MIRHAFTLIELLVTLAVIALLVSILLPSLAASRDSARTTVCLSNQRQLVLGWSLYANANAGRAMPAEIDAPGGSELLYWFGAVSLADSSVAHERGHIAPYLDASLAERSVYECPAQPWGTYRAQPVAAGPAARPTTTYGYNGYYLCPAGTPGWRDQIGAQRWKSLADLDRPAELFVFVDTLLPGTPPVNDAILDPPSLFSAGQWTDNPFPNTSFRHARSTTRSVRIGSAATARADGSARAVRADPAWLIAPTPGIGSVGTTNDPHYVPDWKSWR